MKTVDIQEIIERLRAAGKDEALLAEVWAYLDDLDISVMSSAAELDALRQKLGEGGVRATVPLWIVFHRRLLDETVG